MMIAFVRGCFLARWEVAGLLGEHENAVGSRGAMAFVGILLPKLQKLNLSGNDIVDRASWHWPWIRNCHSVK